VPFAIGAGANILGKQPMPEIVFKKWNGTRIDRTIKVMLSLTGFSVAVVAVQSLQWPMEHDSVQFVYMAFLIDHWGLIPYKDFFEVNMPGTHLFNVMLCRVFGFTDLGFRIADLLCVGIIVGSTACWVKKLDWTAGLFGSLAFALLYFHSGPSLSLQRDFVVLVPLSLALLLTLSCSRINRFLLASIIGLLFGMASTIKPQAGIGLPAIMLFEIAGMLSRTQGRFIRLARIYCLLGSAAVGFAIPIVAMIAILWTTGALPHFLEYSCQYWPLYAQMTGLGESLTGLPRTYYLIANYFLFGGFQLLLVPAVLGAYIASFQSHLDNFQKRIVVLLWGLAALYSCAALLPGKFFPYHWIIFAYFLTVLSSLCLLRQTGEKGQLHRSFAVAVMIVALLPHLAPPLAFLRPVLLGKPIHAPAGGRVDEIADYLKAHMRPEDTVQALDWVGGALHAMLLAKAKTATPFLYDQMFYHDLSNPFIQRLRKQFLKGLSSALPRFIIEIEPNKPRVSGADTTAEFTELRQFIDRYYTKAIEQPKYIIYERRL
jgi:hypothetical protein